MNEDDEISTFDQKEEKLFIIEDVFNEYGCGLHTIKNIIIAFLIFLVEGLSLTYFSYMVIPFKDYYQMTDYDVKITSGVLYLGIGVGSISLGFITAKFSRTPVIYFFVGLIFVAAAITATIKNLLVLIVCRFLNGFSIGIMVPSTINILTEFLPSKNRSLLISSTWFLGFRTGQFSILLPMLKLMPNLEAANSKITLTFMSIFPLVTFLVILLFLEESPRFLILSNKESQAFEILEKYKGEKISKKQRDHIVNRIKSGNKNLKGEIKDLFKSSFIYLTILLILIWMNCNIVYYGPLLISTYTLKEIGIENHNNNVHQIIVNHIFVILVGLSGLFMAGPLSEIKILGRKGALIIGSSFAATFIILCTIFTKYYFFWYGLTLSFLGICFNIASTYTSEVYPTKIRDHAMGFLFFFGRFGAAISQPTYVSINNISPWIPYYFTFCLIGLNILFYSILPYDTYGKALDNNENLNLTKLEEKSILVNDEERKLLKNDS